MRREIMRPLGLVRATTTSRIHADSVIVSTELTSRYTNNDQFNGWFATIVIDSDGSGTPANGLGTTVRRVNDFAASSGTLTVNLPALTDEGSDQVQIDLYRFHPDDILRAFNRARQDAFPQIGIVRDVETIVTGPNQFLYTVPSSIRRIVRVEYGNRISAVSVAENLLLNEGFETWTNATTAESWSFTAGGSSSLNEEAQTSAPGNYAVLQGSRSARVDVQGSSQLDQLLNPSASIAIEGLEIHFSIWMYHVGTSEATQPSVSVRLQGAGLRSSPVTGDNHTRTGWERLKVSGFTNGAAALNSNVNVRIGFAYVSERYECYVDEAVCVVGPSEPHDRPWDLVTNYDWIPPVAGASDGGLIRLSEALTSGRRLRIVGVDLLSSVTVDTDTVEVDGELLNPLYDLTRAYLCEEKVKEATSVNYIRLWGDRQSEYMRRFEDALDTGMTLRMPRKPLMIPDRVY
jgi:hypothetical protein